MKRKPFKVQIDPDHERALHELGEPYNLTGNVVLAAAAAELKKVRDHKGNLWHALGRIAGECEGKETLPAGNPARIARGSHGRALVPVT